MRKGDHKPDESFYFISVTLPSQTEANRKAETGYFLSSHPNLNRSFYQFTTVLFSKAGMTT